MSTAEGAGAAGEEEGPTLQEGQLDILAIYSNPSSVLQLHQAVVQAGQADSDRAGADSIRVISTLPGGACRMTSLHPHQPSAPA